MLNTSLNDFLKNGVSLHTSFAHVRSSDKWPCTHYCRRPSRHSKFQVSRSTVCFRWARASCRPCCTRSMRLPSTSPSTGSTTLTFTRLARASPSNPWSRHSTVTCCSATSSPRTTRRAWAALQHYTRHSCTCNEFVLHFLSNLILYTGI